MNEVCISVGWSTRTQGRKPHGGCDPTLRNSPWLIFTSGSLLMLRNCFLNTGSFCWIRCLRLSMTSSLVMFLVSVVLSFEGWALKSQVDLLTHPKRTDMLRVGLPFCAFQPQSQDCIPAALCLWRVPMPMHGGLPSGKDRTVFTCSLVEMDQGWPNVAISVVSQTGSRTA